MSLTQRKPRPLTRDTHSLRDDRLFIVACDESVVTSLKNAQETEVALREALDGQYDKTNLKSEHYPLSAVCNAYLRSERLDKMITGGTIPKGNTSRVYMLWKAILAKSLASQLPLELKGLLSHK